MKLQSIELERAKVLEEFVEARKWARIVERAVQDQFSESMEIVSDEGEHMPLALRQRRLKNF